MMIPVLWGSRLRLREVKYLAQGHSWGLELPPIQPHTIYLKQSVSKSLRLKSKKARFVSEEQIRRSQQKIHPSGALRNT